MSLGNLVLSCLFTYLLLLVLLRISGKRTIAEGTVLDFLVALILGDMIDNVLLGEAPVAQFLVAAGTLMAVHLLLEYATFRSPAFERLVAGLPIPLVHNARFVREGMRREWLSVQEVLMQLRSQGVKDVNEVRVCQIENTGFVGLIKRRWARAAQKQDAARVRRKRDEAA